MGRRDEEPPLAAVHGPGEEAMREATELMRLGREREAIAALGRAFDVEQISATAHNKAGICYARLHDYKSARREFEYAVLMDDRHADAYCNLGSVFRDIGDYEHALLSYQRAIDVAPAHATARFNLISTFREMGRAGCAPAAPHDTKPPQTSRRPEDGFMRVRSSRWFVVAAIAALSAFILIARR